MNKKEAINLAKNLEALLNTFLIEKFPNTTQIFQCQYIFSEATNLYFIHIEINENIFWYMNCDTLQLVEEKRFHKQYYYILEDTIKYIANK